MKVLTQNPFNYNHFPTKSLSFSIPAVSLVLKPCLKPSAIRSFSLSTHNHSNVNNNYDFVKQQHKNLLVESFHYNNRLKRVIEEVSKSDSDPIRVFERDGDWSKEQFWAVVVLLLEEERISEALQVFDSWKNRESSPACETNYAKFIKLLCERNLMEPAISIFYEIQKDGIVPTLATYNDIIHGLAINNEFDKSLHILNRMVEGGTLPTPETYHGLINAYGNYNLYDEISKCVKKMETEGTSPNEVTYNLLIIEFARGGLVKRMEGAHKTLQSKRMNLQPHTLVTMLEAYSDLGILGKAEKIYRRVLNSKAYMKESIIRKLAKVYIDNSRFVRLEEFGNEISSVNGRNELTWCILLLSSACLLSKKGVESIVRNMDAVNGGDNITITNILGLFYLKIKDFKALDGAFSRIEMQKLKPDMVSFGILFDACRIGYSGTHVLDAWQRNSYLEREVEIDTDPLVLAAFGKGWFFRTCEKIYLSLGTKEKERKIWTYGSLINLAFRGEKSS